MANRFVHVGFSFPGVPKMRDLEPAFDVLGDWVRYGATNWILWTDKPASEIVQRLVPSLDPQDNLFVAGIQTFDTFGRMPPWVWHWMSAKHVAEFQTGQGLLNNPPRLKPST